LRPNVPDSMKAKATEWLRGYYSHIAALDYCIGELQEAIREAGIEENTIFVFTSDHGDMLGSHGLEKKTKTLGRIYCRTLFIEILQKIKGGRNKESLFFPDIMPTLLGLSNMEIPETVEGSITPAS